MSTTRQPPATFDNDIFEGGQREPRLNSEIRPVKKEKTQTPLPSTSKLESENTVVKAMAS